MLAVEVHNLRKEFRRRRGRRRVPFTALKDISFTIERGETVAILGQNGSGKSTLVRLLSTLLLHDGGSARVFGHDVFAESAGRPQAREPRLGRSLLLQEDVRGREPQLRGSLLRDDVEADARRDPAHPRSRRLPVRPAQRVDGEPLARHAAEGGAGPRAADVAGAAAAGRADDGPRPALEARGAELHPRDPARRTSRRSCSARTTSPRPRRSPTASGSSTAASCSRSSRLTTSRSATARQTLEEAFFAATGRAFEEEMDDEDIEREVFA